MRKGFFGYVALALLIAPAYGQGFGGMFPGPGTAHSAGGGGYTGQGDLKTYAAWYGLRAYSAATRGNNAIQACDSGDAHCVNIPTNASTGDLVVSTVVGSSACNNSTNVCTIKTWYDQSGHSVDQVQATSANRSTLVTSCIGSLPCGRTTSAVSYPAVSATVAQPFSALWLSKRTGSLTSQQDMLGSFGGVELGYSNANNTTIGYAGACCDNRTASDNAYHHIIMVGNGASGSVTVDATLNSSVNLGTNSFSDVDLFGGDRAAPFVGDFLEGGVAGSDVSASHATICGNANTYWGTSLSC